MTQALTISKGWSNASYGSGVAFVLYAAASILWSSGGQTEASLLLFSLVVSFWFGYFMRSLYWIWTGFAVFLIYNIYLALTEDAWGIYGNPNLLGCALALGLASALVYRLWLFILPVAYGLWLTQSRGAILGASAALFLWTWSRSRFWAIILANLGVLAIFLSSHNQAAGIYVRLGIWQDTLNHLSILGQGFGSFRDVYWAFPIHTNVGFARPDHAYNDYLELLFELGLGAVFLWTFLIQVLSGAKSEAKLIIYTYLALALTFFPLWVLPIGPLVAATLGNLARQDGP